MARYLAALLAQYRSFAGRVVLALIVPSLPHKVHVNLAQPSACPCLAVDECLLKAGFRHSLLSVNALPSQVKRNGKLTESAIYHLVGKHSFSISGAAPQDLLSSTTSILYREIYAVAVHFSRSRARRQEELSEHMRFFFLE